MGRKAVRKRRLTSTFIKRDLTTEERNQAPFLVWDEVQPNLALQVLPSGTKSYKAIYTFERRSRWLSLGKAKPQQISLTDARTAARKVMAKVLDPTNPRDPATEKRQAKMDGTFSDLADAYISEYAKHNLKSWQQSEMKIDLWLRKPLGKKLVWHITQDDIRRIFDDLTGRGSPISANQAVTQASTIFDWAIKRGKVGLPNNPASGIERNKTHKRTRSLFDPNRQLGAEQEIVQFWHEWDEHGLVVSRAFRMAALTGQRISEIAHMRWSDLQIGEHEFFDERKPDDEQTYTKHGAWWFLAGKADDQGWPGTKNKRDHSCWLSPQAMDVLHEMEDSNDKWVFASNRGTPIAIARLQQAMGSISKKLRVERATPHDLRRTAATILGESGLSDFLIGTVLNHTRTGVTAGYNRATYRVEVSNALDRLGGKIASTVGENWSPKIAAQAR